MTAEAFAFATDRSVRPWTRAFGIHPETCTAQVTDTHLTIAFGRWRLTTPLQNIAGATVTGPYRREKVAGPPRLSLADRGLTFATTTERGVCVDFVDPVPAVEPLGLVRHPAVTVTVGEPERFREVLLAAASRAVARDAPPDGRENPRQGTYRASARAVLRWQRRDDSVRHEQRLVEAIVPPSWAPSVDDGLVQRFDDGVGPAFHRRYAIEIAGADTDADGAMSRLGEDPNRATNEALAPLTKVAGPFGRMAVGDRYSIALAGPWSAPVLVIDVAPGHVRLATLAGHLEAGVIEFRAEPIDADDGSGGADGRMRFVIESWARSGDHALRALYDVLGVARALQSEMWVELCEAMVAVVGGTQVGPVEVLTERAAAPR